MIALDTNVLARWVLEDDPEQARTARELLREAVDRQETCLLSDVVLVELAWLLTSRYRVDRQRLAQLFRSFLTNDLFTFEDRAAVALAVAAFESETGGFADYLVGFKCRAAGARVTYTFDRALRKTDTFSVLS